MVAASSLFFFFFVPFPMGGSAMRSIRFASPPPRQPNPLQEAGGEGEEEEVMFSMVTEDAGEQTMAIRPWLGAIVAPSDYHPSDPPRQVRLPASYLSVCERVSVLLLLLLVNLLLLFFFGGGRGGGSNRPKEINSAKHVPIIATTRTHAHARLCSRRAG